MFIFPGKDSLKLSLFCRGILYKHLLKNKLFYIEGVVLLIQFLFSVISSWSQKTITIC
jgi:hypothetical protein